jgi:hypothetical protein
MGFKIMMKKSKQLISERVIAFIAVVVSAISFMLLFFRIDIPTHIQILPSFTVAVASSVAAYAAMQALSVWRVEKKWAISNSILIKIRSINNDIEILLYSIKDKSMTNDIFKRYGVSFYFNLQKLIIEKDNMLLLFPDTSLGENIDDLVLDYESFKAPLYGSYAPILLEGSQRSLDFGAFLDGKFLRDIEKKSDEISKMIANGLK